MYTAHFGLKDKPFSITPDPGYLYMSSHHQEALAHLLYGTEENGGFVQLTGEVGTGKTTLIRTLLEQQMDKVDFALCLNPRLTMEEFVATVCDELKVDYPSGSHTLKTLVDALNKHLLQTHAGGRHTVLVIDEAQNLSCEVLEQVRLLTNLETHRHKLLRIILVGQPELQRLLEHQNLRQLAQRITARYHLMPLNRKETLAYVVHRLRVAGGDDNLFTVAARKAVYRLSGGVPRLINIICDRALLGAYSRNSKQVDAFTVYRAAREALRGPSVKRSSSLKPWLVTGTAVAAAVLAGVGLYQQLPKSTPILPAGVSQVVTSAEDKAIASEELPDSNAQKADVEALLFAEQPPKDAVEKLLTTWGEEPHIPAGVLPCNYVKTLTMRCLQGRAEWDELRLYNHPVILELENALGDKREVLLRTLDSNTATLDLAGGPVRTSLVALEPLWTGRYLLLWRLQTSESLIGLGTIGEPVVWLRQRLAMAAGEASSTESISEVFDTTLQRQVRDFQRTHNLQADGVVGKRTMTLLNNLEPAPGTPFLIPTAANEVQ